MKKEAMLYKRLSGERVQCLLCNHLCQIAISKHGFCGVRQNIEGRLYTYAYGEVVANHVDPIEKKPLYHFFPGTTSYSIATAGCNFRCGFCQNWRISQSSKRDAFEFESGNYELKTEDVIREAKRNRCTSISYTYTEPTIFFEYAYDIARLAKKEGLYNNFVTNGYMTKDALDLIKPYLDAANVDLKFFNNETYQKICKGRLRPVLDSIRYMKDLGIWVEVTTLIVPGLNDSGEELKNIAKFIAGLGNEIPWHISRFHPDYQYRDSEATPIETLRNAYRIGKETGLRYVYLGNVLEGTNTSCYNCGKLLITRGHLYTLSSNLDGARCPRCGTILDGRIVG